MRLHLKLKALSTSSHDALNLRETPSGREFSTWEAVSATSRDIATAVIAAISGDILDTQNPTTESQDDHEDFGQPDTGLHPCSSHNLTTLRLAAARANSRVVRRKFTSRPHLHRPALVKLKHFSLLKSRVAATGWIGLRDHGVSEEEQSAGIQEGGWRPTYQLEDFFGERCKFPGFQLEKYLGPVTRPVVDAAGRVCAVFAGHEDDPNFMEDVHDPAVEAMEAAREACSVSEARTYHRRGNFTTLTTGQSYGGGQIEPGTIVNGVINTAVLCCLLSHSAFIRLAGFATGVFANCAPLVYDYYAIHMRSFSRMYPSLTRPFINGIWSACTFNLGPQTCTLVHRDFGNLAFGWCAITALGRFDYTKGGHLILWDCHLILEFPPGTTILVPSATIFHSNIPISPNECRYSFSQYTAGGLFRWVQHGFQSEDQYWASLSPAEKKAEDEEKQHRFEDGVFLYSHIDDLQ